LQIPIEKLCLQTKNVLETCENAAAAHRSCSESKCIDNLYSALIARGRCKAKRENTRIYMGFFWRLRGSSHVPPISAPHSTDLARLDNSADFWKKSVILEMPTEKLCLQTRNVLETYESAAAAQTSVSWSNNLDRFYFALIGKGSCKTENPRVYLAFFWRLQGSSHVPPIRTPDAERKRPPGKRNSSWLATRRSATFSESRNVHSQRNTQGPLSTAQILNEPIEKLCLDTGNVLEGFETAKDAVEDKYGPRSDSNRNVQDKFVQVLRGRSCGKPYTTKGYFWRLQGSKLLPPLAGDRGTPLFPSSAIVCSNLKMNADCSCNYVSVS
jgi:hypothetical protein